MNIHVVLGIPEYVVLTEEDVQRLTRNFKLRLASLIEKGLTTAAKPMEYFLAGVSWPISCCDDGVTVFATALGYAMLGLGAPPKDTERIWKLADSRTAQKLGGQLTGISAVADILGLPYELLRDVEKDHQHGEPLGDIIESLRK